MLTSDPKEPRHVPDWQLLAEFSRMFTSLSGDLLEQVDVHRGQAILLCHLFAEDGLTQSELAEQLAVQAATVTNLLQRLEDAGLVVRRRDGADRRVVRVYLSDQGRSNEDLIHAQFGKLEKTVFQGVSYADRLALRRVFRQLIDNMRQ